jgi:hypothetical protein
MKQVKHKKSTKRVVREEGADHPKLLPEPPIVHREKRTVRDGPTDRPPRHGLSDTLVRAVRKLHAPKTHRQNGSKERHSRTRTNTKNSWAVRNLVDSSRLPRGRSTTCESAQPRNTRNNLKIPIDGSPKPQGVLRRNFGEMMNTPKRGYAPKSTASNILQLPELQILAKNTMT